MELQTIITIAAIFITILTLINGIRLKHKREEYSDLLLDKVESDIELRQTLAMGLYLRFKKENKDETSYSATFIKEDPLAFEHFVADIIKSIYGGEMFVSKASGDFGVDFENRREDGLYLGQVKCVKDDLSFESIALVHSNMEKWGAVGGLVITTAGFTDKAMQYAEGLGVEIISGIELVDMWLKSMESETELIKQLDPSDV
ncbi:restriction endonuclease [Halalkalibacter alkalisediminis]|uniref:Restriction endonuclease n=1 Tax=Halalkalibacter alkalisediminis TaxID=935616 RepID=A0ABV6NQB8_9BACI|nr:restriction endonuclease [Halalkalibacter alkalisediminis]